MGQTDGSRIDAHCAAVAVWITYSFVMAAQAAIHGIKGIWTFIGPARV